MAPPSGVVAPAMPMPHAMASRIGSAGRLVRMSFSPTKSSMETAIGVITAQVIVFGRNRDRSTLAKNQAQICWCMEGPTRLSTFREIRRPSPVVFQVWHRNSAPSSCTIVSEKYWLTTTSTGASRRKLTATTGSSDVTA